jgi:hypothetical protein
MIRREADAFLSGVESNQSPLNRIHFRRIPTPIALCPTLPVLVQIVRTSQVSSRAGTTCTGAAIEYALSGGQSISPGQTRCPSFGRGRPSTTNTGARLHKLPSSSPEI